MASRYGWRSESRFNWVWDLPVSYQLQWARVFDHLETGVDPGPYYSEWHLYHACESFQGASSSQDNPKGSGKHSGKQSGKQEHNQEGKQSGKQSGKQNDDKQSGKQKRPGKGKQSGKGKGKGKGKQNDFTSFQ